MRLKYENVALRGDTLAIVEQADAICREYDAQGYELTLRQLYYQFVARGYIPNTQQSYARLGDIVDKGRMAGMIDWDHIVDRTRYLSGTTHWETPGDVINSAAAGYRIDKWSDQDLRVEVWVEKEALAGVIERAARRWDVDYFSCRGYVSQSAMWRAGRRMRNYFLSGQRVLVLHLGDHDPSGLDMTRDIRERLALFSGASGQLEVKRIALNMAQVEQYAPPPNPAKMTDSRSAAYVEEFGSESWELDALPPDVLAALIDEAIEAVIDPQRYNDLAELETRDRELLSSAASRWGSVADMLRSGDDED